MVSTRSTLTGLTLFVAAVAPGLRAQISTDHFVASCRAEVMSISGRPRLVLFGGLDGFGSSDYLSWYNNPRSSTPFPGVDLHVRRAFVHVTDPCQIGMWLGLRGNQGNPDLNVIEPITRLGWNGGPMSIFDPIIPTFPTPWSGLAPQGSDLIWDIRVGQAGPW